MSMLNDPSMKEIVEDFCKEASELFMELQDVLEVLEENPDDSAELENFGQIIDRVMGAARSIGADEIATFCELGKTIGYKSSQIDDISLLNIVVAVLFDAVDILIKMVDQLKTGNPHSLEGLSTEAFVSRLNWLSDKFKDIERSSCAMDGEGEGDMDQSSIDDLMASLGL